MLLLVSLAKSLEVHLAEFWVPPGGNHEDSAMVDAIDLSKMASTSMLLNI
jgi:hypothetical protein